MSECSDYNRRDHLTDTLLEFERRIQERVLAVDDSECYDLTLNRQPTLSGESPHAPGLPRPLCYETRAEVPVLRIVEPDAPNRACPDCDLFGQSHCCGGLLFLYYALRDAGEKEPMRWLAVEVAPGEYLPDWELMSENRRRILQRVRDYFEANLNRIRE